MKFHAFIVALLAISTILFTVEAAPANSGFPIAFTQKDLRDYRNKVKSTLFKNVKFICDNKNDCGTPAKVEKAKKEITDRVINTLEDNFNKLTYNSLDDINGTIGNTLRRLFLTIRGFAQANGVNKDESLSSILSGCGTNIRNPLEVLINKLKSENCNSKTSNSCKKREDEIKQSILRKFNFN
jgi:hypothetical protein